MELEEKSVVIALSGKEGVGKTTISAVMTKILMNDKSARILVIDADPDVCLATALGIRVSKTVDDIKKEMLETIRMGDKKDNQKILTNLESEVFNVMLHKDNLTLLAIGSLKEDDSFYIINSLLKYIMESIVLKFDYIIIDGEVGIEQINRRVMEKVTHLVLVSDASPKGINVIRTINEVTKNLLEYEKVGFILNRLRTKEEVNVVNLTDEIPLLTYILDNDNLRDFDVSGKNILELPEGSLIQSIRIALSKLNV